MVDVVKAAFYIALNEPARTDKLVFELGQCCVTASAGAKSVRGIRENRFIGLTGAFFHSIFGYSCAVQVSGGMSPFSMLQ